MKILVAGASGFIGKNFILNLPRAWEIFGLYHQSKDFLGFLKANNIKNVIAQECDLRNCQQVKQVFRKYGGHYDVCLFLVGNSDIGLSIAQPELDLNSNVITLLNLIGNVKVKRFIFISSGTVYLGQRGRVTNTTLVSPLVPYGISKLCSELYIKSYQRNTDRIKEYVILRFFGAYGPMEPPRKIYTNLINAFYFDNKDEYTLRGNGKNYIDAMYIDDAVNGLLKVVKSNKANLTIDFCKGQPLTINDLVARVAQILGKGKIKIKHRDLSSEYIGFYASPKKMEEIYGFRPRISLEDGINTFLEFLKK